MGWYHSHTRSEIFLSDADLEIHNRYFPEPWQVALVLNRIRSSRLVRVLLPRSGCCVSRTDATKSRSMPFRCEPAPAGPPTEVPQPVGRADRGAGNDIRRRLTAPAIPCGKNRRGGTRTAGGSRRRNAGTRCGSAAGCLTEAPAPRADEILARSHDLRTGGDRGRRISDAARSGCSKASRGEFALRLRRWSTAPAAGSDSRNRSRRSVADHLGPNAPPVRQAVDGNLEISGRRTAAAAISLDQAHLQNGTSPTHGRASVWT